MAQENRNRLMGQPVPAHKSVLGSWQGETFQFTSPDHERAWQQQAYRQSVHPDRWQGQAPVDAPTQSLLDDMPHLGGGQFFRAPDGKHRRITMEQREDVDVAKLRRTAFNEYAQSGVTWHELAKYPDDKSHPGEDEALALMDTKRVIAKQAATADAAVDDIGVPRKDPSDLTHVAGDLDLDLNKGAWDLGRANAAPTPIQVATTDKAIVGLPKEVEKAQPFLSPPATTPRQRREFNEGLIGAAANDNKRTVANDNGDSAASSAARQQKAQPAERSPGKATGAGSEAATEAEEWATANRLFNWSRLGKAPPAPAEYALNVVSDAGRFTYLEEMKDEWSRLLEKDPEKVFQSMTGEAEKLSNAAMQDFVTGYHRQPNPAEKAEIEDAVAKMVFAPAERWTKAGDKPNEKVAEPKAFLGIVEPERISGQDAADVLSEASQAISQLEIEKFGGRLGSEETRDMAELMTQKLAAAIKACGGEIIDTYFGRKERLIRRDPNSLKGANWTDIGADFKYNGKQIGAYGNHAGTWANGRTLLANEARQIYSLAHNLAHAIGRGELGISVAGFGYFSKRKPNQSMEDYLKKMDEFISDMIDCGRPFLVRANFKKFEAPFPETANEDTGAGTTDGQ
ncbi:hypothetical protein [Dongia sp.]|uniref:hypothetical protein n=1 Tax=Dongia sp. TaxID=1977262 RepID=UPI0035B19137